ncbi:lysoplasmalogenase [Flavobacterium branchiophilum]|nr:lysoplasmalogenase [Flavobacterium branchiophilum]
MFGITLKNQMMKTINLIQKLFFINAVVYLILLSIECPFAPFFKALIVLILMAKVVFQEPFPTKKIVLYALFFSWLGDVLLIFNTKSALFFIFGLVGFLISHVFYCLTFIQQKNAAVLPLKLQLMVAICFTIYFFYILSILYPYLGTLKIPVIVYAMVITFMGFFGLKISLYVYKNDHFNITIGAVLFVFSDSILAINKFATPIQNGNFIIMLSYILAQYLLISGIIKQNKH